jgi:Putative MetA-pathway of phenol degradation
LNGATIGLPLGALPPPGLYSGLETAYLGLAGQNGGRGNQAGGLAAPAVAQAVPFLYVPGWNFLGATYAMGVMQAFYMFDVLAKPGTLNTPPSAVIAHGEVLANTTFSPLNLSWNLGQGWFYSISFNFMAPDGSRWATTPNPDYWTLEPAMAISYLANNWVLSANFFYDINTRSTGPCCVAVGALGGGLNVTSGNTFYGDFTAVYKIGKWERPSRVL